MKPWMVRLPWVPLSGNKVTNKWSKSGQTKKWIDRLRPAVREGPWPKGSRGRHLTERWTADRQKVYLEILVIRKRTHREEDNRQRSAKAVVDALVTLGWMVDDADSLLDLTLYEEPCRGRREGTLIRWSPTPFED